MKRIISITLLLAMALSMVASATAVKGFSDVPKTEWSYNYIMLCAQNGAVNGTTNPDENGIATFAPKMEVSLGQFLAAMTKLLCPTLVKPLEEGQQWTLPYYNAAIEAKLISKAEFDYANINEKLSREDMAYILVSAAKFNGEVLEAKDGIENAIADYDKVSADRKDAVEKAYSNGLITGTDANGTFAPKNSMTREQMATVICRLMKWTERAEVKPADPKPTEPSNPGNTDFEEGGWKGDDYGSNEDIIGDATIAGQFVDNKDFSREFYKSGMSAEDARQALNRYIYNVYSRKFFADGIKKNNADDGKFARFVTHSDGRLGINVFQWRKSYDSSTSTNTSLNAVMEAFYFFTKDKDVAYALFSWTDAAAINNGDADSNNFGFTDVRATANGGVIKMNGIQIEADFSDNSYTYYFN